MHVLQTLSPVLLRLTRHYNDIFIEFARDIMSSCAIYL